MAEREILFRGKRLHDNKWIYGNFVSDCEGNSHIIEPRFFCEDGHHLQYEDNTDTPVFIIPETVGQFTGSTDKNGKKIFEGDIVSIAKYGGLIYKVVYALCRYELVNSKGVNCFVLDIYKSKDIEVIGNIHDNPEMLKGASKPIAQDVLASATDDGEEYIEGFTLMQG